MHDRHDVVEHHELEWSLSSALLGPSCCHYFRWCWTYSRSQLWYKHKGDQLRVPRQLTISFAYLSSSYVRYKQPGIDPPARLKRQIGGLPHPDLSLTGFLD